MTITYGDSGPSEEISDALLEVYGVDARYFPRGGEPFDLQVIFRAPRRRVRADAEGQSGRAVMTQPTAKAPRHVLADARQGETLFVAGTYWDVSEPPEADGAVWTLLTLKKADGPP